MKSHKILVINPGSTSTKISLFENGKEKISEKISHQSKVLQQFKTVLDQKDFRLELIINALHKNKYKVEDLTSVVGRGGLLKPISSGTYKVNKKMIKDLSKCRTDHPCNLGAILALELSIKAKCDAYIVDPVVVDEFISLARYTGSKYLERQSIFHALNQKAVARKVAKKLGKDYKKCNFVVAHLGGGISIGAHEKGMVIDNNNALDGEGPFSPERSGTLPIGQWLELITSGKYQKMELKRMIKGGGGLVSYLGTSNALKVDQKVKEKNAKYTEVQQAMCYQISKEIGAYATTICGKVDRIILTGGLSFSSQIVKEIKKRTQWIAPVVVIPGEMEMEALYLGALRVIEGKEKAKVYR